MKKITLLILILTTFNLIGQENLKISIDNTAPRVGQKVTISFSPDIISNYFQNELGDGVKVLNSGPPHTSHVLTRIIIFNESGNYTIGPFSFDFNRKKYRTNSITINIRPALPDEDGLWLRLIQVNREEYLELEQRVTKIDNGYSLDFLAPTNSASKPNIAGLKLNLTDGIRLIEVNSTYNTVNDITTSTKKYHVIFDSNFSGTYMITDKDFNNYPEGIKFHNVKIKK